MDAAEIATVAKAAGLSGDKVAVAVAIALAESGGNPRAHNRVPPDNSYGLWQINMLGSLGPARRKALGLSSNDELFNPAVNARAMMMISNNGANWRPWTTYTRGTYLRFMSEARAASGGAGPVTTPAALPGGLDNLRKAFTTITDSRTWIRVGLAVGGGTLCIIAVSKLTGDNQLSATTKMAAKAVITRKL